MKELDVKKIDYVLGEVRADGNRAHYAVLSDARDHLTDLQKQNDELRAKLEALESIVNGAALSPSNVIRSYKPEVSIHLRQSLSGIRAEAVMSIMDNVDDFEAFGSPKMMEVRDIIEYANRIKEG